MSRNYDDIINLPHHTSLKHPRMSREARAAQFSPFAALTGFEEDITETARLTDEFREIEEYDRGVLDEKLKKIQAEIDRRLLIRIIYFVPDKYKEGGSYSTYEGKVRVFDEVNRMFVFEEGRKIGIDMILSIELLDV